MTLCACHANTLILVSVSPRGGVLYHDCILATVQS